MSCWCTPAYADRNKSAPSTTGATEPYVSGCQIAAYVAQVAILIAALILRIGNN
jgi:hypothetical protein